MEQLTPQEWAREQIRRAPSFAIATALMAGMLLLSTVIEYSSGARKVEDLTPVEAEIAQEEPALLEHIKELIAPERPDVRDLKPVEGAPVVDDPNAVPSEGVNAPLGGVGVGTGVDTIVTEDATSDGGGEATDPVPMEYTKRLAVISSEPGTGTGGFRGAFANRRTQAGKRKVGITFGMPRETLPALDHALEWLKKTQNTDGSWDVAKWGGSQSKAIAGVTGLALLAYLGYGCIDRPTDPKLQPYAETVVKAVRFLVSRQTTDGPNKGWFGERMYEQGICTMALSEASALLETKRLREEARHAAQYGLDYILSKQPTHGGFAYTGPGTDVSVTGWQVMAIKSAITAELYVPKAAKERTEKFLDVSTAKDYSTPYQFSPTGDTHPGTPRMTAVGLTCRLFMGHKRNAPDCVGQAEWLTKNDQHLKVAQTGRDLYYIYYMSLAMFQMGGEYWKKWNDAFNKGLRESQEKDGPDKGSWPVQGTCFGAHGGRVYTTAMACLALEVYFRYLPLYKGF